MTKSSRHVNLAREGEMSAAPRVPTKRRAGCRSRSCWPLTSQCTAPPVCSLWTAEGEYFSLNRAAGLIYLTELRKLSASKTTGRGVSVESSWRGVE